MCVLVISRTIIDSIAAHGLAPVVTTKEKDGESEASLLIPLPRSTRSQPLRAPGLGFSSLRAPGLGFEGIGASEPSGMLLPGICFFCCDRSRAVTFRFGCVK